jgi:hypothetical protein
MSDNLPAEWNQGTEEGIETVDVAGKEDLVGMPFLVTSIRISEGDFGPMASAHIELPDGTELVLVDGSTGVFRQLSGWLAKHRDDYDANGLTGSQYGTWDVRFVARKGLRVSRYPNPNGEGISSTFYIA